MTDETADGLRERITRQSEETLAKIAQDLLDNPLVGGALSRAFDARERAAQAQVAALGALNLPSAADLERLTRRLRSVSQRLEGIEDAVDRLDDRIARSPSELDQMAAIEQRLAALDEAMNEIVASLANLRAGEGGAEPATRKPAARKSSG